MTEADLNLAMHQAVSELRQHGGSEADVAQLVQQFKALRQEAEEAANAVDGIPD